MGYFKDQIIDNIDAEQEEWELSLADSPEEKEECARVLRNQAIFTSNHDEEEEIARLIEESADAGSERLMNLERRSFR